MPQGPARDHEPIGVDRVGRVRHQHHVARCRDHHRQVRQPLLRAQRRNHLGLRVQLHPEPPVVIPRLRPPQSRNALRRRIAMRARLPDRLDQLLDDMAGRIHIRIAHAEIDDVHALGAILRLQPVGLGEDIGRQALDAVELFFGHDGRPVGIVALRYRSRPSGFPVVKVPRSGLFRQPRPFSRCQNRRTQLRGAGPQQGQPRGQRFLFYQAFLGLVRGHAHNSGDLFGCQQVRIIGRQGTRRDPGTRFGRLQAGTGREGRDNCPQ